MAMRLNGYRYSVILVSAKDEMEVNDQAYLDQVVSKVQECNQHYQIQFSECRDMIKKYSSEAVETKVLAGIGNAEKSLG